MPTSAKRMRWMRRIWPAWPAWIRSCCIHSSTGAKSARPTWPSSTPARSFHKRAKEHIPEALLPALDPILEQIGSLTERIQKYDRKLEEISKESYPETDLLRRVEGIGPLTALTFVLTLEDPHRFEKSRSVGAYLGLVPATDRSGDSDPQKRISKEGD